MGLDVSFPGGRSFSLRRRTREAEWRGLPGRMCPKRRRLKPRRPGYLQETLR